MQHQRQVEAMHLASPLTTVRTIDWRDIACSILELSIDYRLPRRQGIALYVGLPRRAGHRRVGRHAHLRHPADIVCCQQPQIHRVFIERPGVHLARRRLGVVDDVVKVGAVLPAGCIAELSVDVTRDGAAVRDGENPGSGNAVGLPDAAGEPCAGYLTHPSGFCVQTSE